MTVRAESVRERLSHRIVRALALARERSATADMLNFYADLCEFQQSLLHEAPRVLPPPASTPFAEALDAAAAASLIGELLQWLDTRPQRGLAEVTNVVRDKSRSEWQVLLDRLWRDGGASRAGVEKDSQGVEEVNQFVAEAFLQPFAETLGCLHIAETVADSGVAGGLGRHRCPVCGGQPFLATLREQGHGARRSLVCGFCLTESPVARVACPWCGERDAESLHIYRAEEFPDIRIDACRSCQAYVKTIDFSVNGAAVPAVDDLASLAMDLWAAGRGYRKLRANLLRL